MTDDFDNAACARRHLRIGWMAVLFFLTLGLVLEAFHGFKVGWYLNVTNEARRLMLTLAHAHGTLFGVINILFALSLNAGLMARSKWLKQVSAALLGATVLLPGGFFLAGFFAFGADPGLGVFVAPVGGLLLFLAVTLIAHDR